MSIVPKNDLVALGLAPDMLGPVERLPLPQPDVHLARGVAPPADADAADLIDARSDVLGAIGLRLRFDADARALHVEFDGHAAVRVRGAHPHAQVHDAADDVLRLPLRQLGRFLLESPDGVPLVVGDVSGDTLSLAAVTRWSLPPIENWMLPMNDAWLQSIVERTLPDADAWTRTALAGTITRLAAVDTAPADDAVEADAVTALLRRVARSPAMAPRAWARALERDALAAIEEHAHRRATALALDLEDLRVALPSDAREASDRWTDLCHRRDELESIRVLLREADTGARLEACLQDTDRAGRAVRLTLEAVAAQDDERLRRVAIGDPSAWWGHTDYEVRLL